jgi:hypothetical protein
MKLIKRYDHRSAPLEISRAHTRRGSPRLDFEEAKFSLYFLALDSPAAESPGKHWTNREGILELTHNCMLHLNGGPFFGSPR